MILDGETTPFVDVSGASMLVQLVGDLARKDVQLLLAQDVGQVRDVLRANEAKAGTLKIYPTVDDAMAAARAIIHKG